MYNSLVKSLLKDPGIAKELENAALARQAGLEGKSRVCARRAAGLAILSYYRISGVEIETKNILATINHFVTNKSVPLQLTHIASYFIEQVNPKYQLSSQVDLLEEVTLLCNGLDQLLLEWRENGN